MTAPGRVTVTRKALSGVLAAVAAEHLGVAPGRVRIDLADDATRLAVAVTGSAKVESSGPSLRDLGARIRTAVHDDGSRLTGAQIGRVTVRITGYESSERRTR